MIFSEFTIAQPNTTVVFGSERRNDNKKKELLALVQQKLKLLKDRLNSNKTCNYWNENKKKHELKNSKMSNKK